MKDKITIYDIAKKLNITAATVSRALNNNPKISESTRKKVLAMADEMHYEQNKLALALKSGKSNTVGVVVPFIDRNFLPIPRRRTKRTKKFQCPFKCTDRWANGLGFKEHQKF